MAIAIPRFYLIKAMLLANDNPSFRVRRGLSTAIADVLYKRMMPLASGIRSF